MKPTFHEFLLHNSFNPFPLEDNSIHLVVTSPPYPMIELWDNILAQYDPSINHSIHSGKGSLVFEKMHTLLDMTWKEVNRVLRPGGFACINIGDATRSLQGYFRLYSNHSRVISAFDGLGFDVLPLVIWKKPTNSPTKFMGSGMLPGGAYVTLEHEYILIFRKPGKRLFDKAEKEVRGRSAIFWEERNSWFSDQWEIRGVRQSVRIKSERSRSAAFPLDIALRPILMYSIYGDKILDPFLGHGTTSMAAILSGRNSIGFDNDKPLVEALGKYLNKRDMKSYFNREIDNRIRGHLDFVRSKDELFFKYRNEILGIPVKTNQEKMLTIYGIKSTNRVDTGFKASYRRLSKSDIRALRSS